MLILLDSLLQEFRMGLQNPQIINELARSKARALAFSLLLENSGLRAKSVRGFSTNLRGFVNSGVKSNPAANTRSIHISNPRRKALTNWKRPSIEEMTVPRDSWHQVNQKNQKKFNTQLAAGFASLSLAFGAFLSQVEMNPAPEYKKLTNYSTRIKSKGELAEAAAETAASEDEAAVALAIEEAAAARAAEEAAAAKATEEAAAAKAVEEAAAARAAEAAAAAKAAEAAAAAKAAEEAAAAKAAEEAAAAKAAEAKAAEEAAATKAAEEAAAKAAEEAAAIKAAEEAAAAKAAAAKAAEEAAPVLKLGAEAVASSGIVEAVEEAVEAV